MSNPGTVRPDAPEESGRATILRWNDGTQRPPAIVTAVGDRIGYPELVDDACALMSGLSRLGMEHGETCAILLPKGYHFVVAVEAALLGGWYVVPINNTLTTGELEHVIADSGARVVFTDRDGVERIRSAASAVRDVACIVIAEPGAPDDETAPLELLDMPGATTGFDAVAALGRERPCGVSSSPGSVMFYTSATTGKPKGVRRKDDSGGVPEAATLVERLTDPTRPGVHLSQGPLHHSGPLMFLLAALHLGHTCILMERWDADTALALITKHRVTNTMMVPTMFHRLLLLDDQVREASDVRSVQLIVHTGASCPAHVKQRMIDWFGPTLFEMYGGTEGGISTCTSAEWLLKPGTVGKPRASVDVRIFDEHLAALPPGAVGTIYFRDSERPLPEYHGDDAKTAASRHDGYFTLGDLGYLDEDGWLYLSGRRSDLIISGGSNIYPVEIESTMLQHPGVGDVAVVGMPDEDLGEIVVAAVEPSDDARGTFDIEDLRSFCSVHLARYKQPRRIELFEALPRGENGKLYRRRLVEALEERNKLTSRTVTMPVEIGHVLAFMRALGNEDPVPLTGPGLTAQTAEVVAPPTFCISSAIFDPEYPMRPKPGDVWVGARRSGSADPEESSERAASGEGRVLHAEQRFEYFAPIHPGDVLTVTIRPGRTWTKEGRRGGTLEFKETVSEYRNAQGVHAVTATAVSVTVQRTMDQAAPTAEEK